MWESRLCVYVCAHCYNVYITWDRRIIRKWASFNQNLLFYIARYILYSICAMIKQKQEIKQSKYHGKPNLWSQRYTVSNMNSLKQDISG